MSQDTGDTADLDLHPLTLYPPNIPMVTSPFEAYHGGISIAAVEHDLLYVIDPWPVMNEGDTVRVYWGDDSAPVYSKTIEAEDVNQSVALRIDKAHILAGDADPVFYSVQRIGTSQPENSEPSLKLLVKLDRPGGYDNDQATPGHSGLVLSIPQSIIDEGVGPDEADAGVPVTINAYLNMRRNDRINLAWGTENIYHTVQEDEVGGDIVITVPRDTLEQAGDSAGVAVTFQVRDVVGNFPGGDAKWSAITYIQVDLNNNRLDAPEVLVNGFPYEEIDLEELAGGDVVVRVRANRTDHALDDILRMTWRGTSSDGASVIVGPLDLTVTTIPSYCDFTIPHNAVEAIAKGRASVSYVRIRNGSPDLPSKSANVTVVGDISLYEAPSIDGIARAELDPDLRFYTVYVPHYPGRSPGDRITVVGEGTTAGGSATYHSEVLTVPVSHPDGAPMTGAWPKAEIKRLDGGSLILYYRVNDQRESRQLALNVGAAAPALALPQVPDAPGDVLNPDDVHPVVGVEVKVPANDLARTGDVLKVHWVGSASGTALRELPYTDASVGKVVSVTFSYANVADNDNGTVDVSYHIWRGNAVVGSSPVLRLSIGTGVAEKPTITDIEDSNGSVLEGITTETEVTVTGSAPTGSSIQLESNGTPIGNSFTVTGTTWSHLLTGLAVYLYSLTARLVDTSLESAPRSFTVTKLIKPTLPKAYNAAGNRLKIGFRETTDLYYDDFLDIQVPPYVGADPSHILNVIWKGRAVVYTEVDPVAGQRVLQVPRLEFVDSIGELPSPIQVSYSVKANAASVALESELISPVYIDEQDFVLLAPAYNPATRVVTISGTGVMQNYKIRVRWAGVVTRDGPEVAVDTSRPYTFIVDPGWVAESNGTTVLLNYTCRLDGDNPILFSHYLRVPISV